MGIKVDAVEAICLPILDSFLERIPESYMRWKEALLNFHELKGLELAKSCCKTKFMTLSSIIQIPDFAAATVDITVLSGERGAKN